MFDVCTLGHTAHIEAMLLLAGVAYWVELTESCWLSIVTVLVMHGNMNIKIRNSLYERVLIDNR